MELDLRRRNQTKLAIRATRQFKPCGNCGTKHGKNKCLAYGKTCHHCGKRNHFQKLCRSKSSENNSVHEVNNEGASNVYNVRERTCTSGKEFFIDTVSANSSIHISQDRAFVQLHIGPQKTPVNFKIDTGSSVNILPQSIHKSLSTSNIR